MKQQPYGGLYIIWDRLANSAVLDQVTFLKADAVAIRMFQDTIRQPPAPKQNPIAAHPDDYDLRCIADVDNEMNATTDNARIVTTGSEQAQLLNEHDAAPELLGPRKALQ